jgi:DNA-binding HxlR family transcriptional regulator
MSYDLRRLRLHGLIRRIDGRHRYVLTEQGRAFAVLYTKLGERVIGPILNTDRPNAPPKNVRSLNTVGRCLDDTINHAGPAIAA